MYFTVFVHEPLQVGTASSLEIRAFQPTTPNSQGWGTSVVLSFAQRLRVLEQTMGGSPKVLGLVSLLTFQKNEALRVQNPRLLTHVLSDN